MIKERIGFFETNSSSSHSLHFDVGCTTFEPFVTDKITITGGEYGWGYDRLDTPIEKIDYIYTLISTIGHGVHEGGSPPTDADLRRVEMLLGVIREFTGAEVEICYDTCSYIDHQSAEYTEALDDPVAMKALLFGADSYIIIDNDNH